MTLSRADRFIEAGALFLLVFTPLAFGTVELWSQAIAALVVLAMAGAYVIGNLKNWELRIELPPGWLPALGFLLLITLQGVVPGRSVDPHATWREALKLLAVATFFLVCWNTYRTRAQVERALWTMIGVGTVIALFAIVQRVTWNGRLYWIGPEALSAFGPFVNRTHFAWLMLIIVSLALALMTSAARPPRRRHRLRGLGPRLREWAGAEGSARAVVPLLVLVMGGAALVSGSRGGVIALLAALVTMVLGALARARSGRGRAARLGLATLAILLAGIWIAGDVFYNTIERLAEELERPGEGWRLQIWADALGLWGEAPVLGSGLATFGVAFLRFRSVPAPMFFSHAESDWVQLLTDTGVLGVAFILGVVASLALALLMRLREADGRWGQDFALAGLVVLVGTVIQGIGNFNLVVMSNLLYLALALVLGLRASETPGEHTARRGAAR
jgi:O-antigen ligase